MLDAIGTLGSVLTTGTKIYDLLKQVHDAPNDIKALQTEVFLMQRFLSQLLDSLTADANQAGPVATRNENALKSLLEQARRLIEDANVFIDDTTTKKADDSVKLRKIKWLWNTDRGEKLTDGFRNFKESLCAVLDSNNT